MKKILLFASGCLLTSAVMWAAPVPIEIKELIGMGMSPNGLNVAAQDVYGNTALIDTKTGSVLNTYYSTYPGNGNCVSNNGIFVGQAIDTNASGVIMKDGTISTPTALQNGGAVNGITPDGSRACGYVYKFGATYMVPFYIDLDENGEGNEIHYLPYPQKDFLGTTPQFVTAVWISDDGTTILGQMVDDTGFYTCPIIFMETADNEWDYILPSAPMFNPQNLPIPEYPDEENFEPKVYDFMTAENRAKFLEALKDYEAGNGSNPMEDVSTYITMEEYEEYLEAVDAYNDDPTKYYFSLLDKYWAEMGKLINNSNFTLGVLSMNSTGTVIASTVGYSNDDSGVSDRVDGYGLWMYNLTDESYKIVPTNYPSLIPNQILADGSILCTDVSSLCSFIVYPDTNVVVPLEEYVEQIDPAWAAWMKNNLNKMTVYTIDGQFEEYLCTGNVKLSANKTVLAGGYQGGLGDFTYILQSDNAGIERLAAELKSDLINVYDLTGKRILQTKNSEELLNLSKGFYIINGKKVLVK